DSLVEVRLDDRDPACVDLVDRVLVDVHALEGEALSSEGGAGRQADVAKADDRNSVMEHGVTLRGVGNWLVNCTGLVVVPGRGARAGGQGAPLAGRAMTARTASMNAAFEERQS